MAGLLPRHSFPTADVTGVAVNASAVNKIKPASSARPTREPENCLIVPIKAWLRILRESFGFIACLNPPAFWRLSVGGEPKIIHPAPMNLQLRRQCCMDFDKCLRPLSVAPSDGPIFASCLAVRING